MFDKSLSFDLFSDLSFADWQKKVEKDLKGKSLEDLNWHLSEDLTVPPMFMAEHQISSTRPPRQNMQSNAWEVGEYIRVTDAKATNAQLLDALENGVEAPLLYFTHNPTFEELDTILDGVHLSMISLHLGLYFPKQDPVALVDHLIRLAEARQQPLKGSLDFDPIVDHGVSLNDLLKTLVNRLEDHLPEFRVLDIDGRPFHEGARSVVRELAYTVAKGAAYIQDLIESGITAEACMKHIQLSTSVGTSYFVEIAKIRALRILWGNVMQVLNVDLALMPPIYCHYALESLDNQENTNMIRSATQAMSAVIGGVDALFAMPANLPQKKDSTAFTRRIARNVQHLLRLESYMEKVVDPAGGSYYIENLTTQFVAKAWEEFLAIEGKGGYFNLK